MYFDITKLTSALKRNREFVGHVVTVSGGTAVGRSVAFVATPIIARLFSPEHYGQAAMFVALAVLLNTVSSLRYEEAIVLPKAQEDAAGLIWLTGVLLCSICMILSCVSVSLWSLEIEYQWSQSLGGWFFMLPVAVLLMGMAKILRAVAVREKHFRGIAKTEIVIPTVTAATRLLASVAGGSSVGGLISGYVLGVVAGLMTLYRTSALWLSVTMAMEFMGRVWGLAKRYRAFPLYSTPTAFLGALSERLPVIMFGVLFEPAVVGFYAIAARLIRTPIKVISNAVRQVFLQKAVEVQNRGNSILGGLAKTTIGLCVLGVPLFIALFIWGEEIFRVILGERWAMSGRYAEVLVPWLFTLFILTPSHAVYVVLERQKLLLGLQIVRTVLTVSVFLVAVMLKITALETLYFLSGAGALSNLAILAIAFSLAADLTNVRAR